MVGNYLQRCDGLLTGALILALGLVGCTDFPSKTTETLETRTQMATMVHERVVELSAMRAEVASARIAAAKKEAEIQELRAALIELRRENADANQELSMLRQERESRQSELERARLEREQVLQAGTAEQVVDLEHAVAALTTELSQIKDELARSTGSARPKPSRLSSNQSPASHRNSRRESPTLELPTIGRGSSEPTIVPAMARAAGPVAQEPQAQITVQTGDTLWSLAKRHKVSVTELRRANKVEGDALRVGTVLTVPASPHSEP